MKQFIEYLVKSIAVLSISILAGAILLILVYMLPTHEMKNNVQRSTAIYDYEDVYPQLMSGYKMSQLDNCTDAYMLLNAIFPGTGNVVKDAMRVNRIEYYDRNPVGSLTDYANDVAKENYTDNYQRYWHGYLVILKPLLLLFDVSDIRVINMFVFFGLLLYIMWLMMDGGLKQYIVPFAFAMLLMNPLAIPLSFQFSTVSYIMLISVIVVLTKKEWNNKQQMLLFMLIGVATAYFDFLTFPLVGLYFPMIFMLMKEKSWKSEAGLVVSGSISWIIGYGGMWAGKWLIGSILTGSNMFKSALSRAGHYTNMVDNGEKVNYLQVIIKNVQVFIKWPIVIAMAAILIYMASRFIKVWKSGKSVIAGNVSYIGIVPFVIIAIAPICWYIVSGTHSYRHYWFTYRQLCVSIFAILSGMVRLYMKNTKIETGF